MFTRPSAHLARGALRTSLRAAARPAPKRRPNTVVPPSISTARSFHISVRSYKGITPDSADPKPNFTPAAEHVAEAAEISTERYHELSDAYIDNLVSVLEEIQEDREDVDVEYSAGVLTLTFPPAGTYVLNKQPPNKQIWLSSPISGPKRYDYVILGEGMHEKEGSGTGDWVYLRDGTTLTHLLRKELLVEIGKEH